MRLSCPARGQRLPGSDIHRNFEAEAQVGVGGGGPVHVCLLWVCNEHQRTVRWKRSARITQAYYASFVPVERWPVRVSAFRGRFMLFSSVGRPENAANLSLTRG